MPPRPTPALLALLAPLAPIAIGCGTSSVRPRPVAEAPTAQPPAAPAKGTGPWAATAAVEPPAEEPPSEESLGGRPYELIEGEPMVTVLPQDAIPALDAPRFVSAEEAFDFMQPEETVLGVVGGDGTAKCYSAWQLDGHEIVNDELDGEPIAATW